MKLKKELLNYLIFGVFTTLVNIISYAFLSKLLQLDFKIAATIAWLLSVLFAYVTNKFYVFESREQDFLTISKELGSFFLSRVLSYSLDIFAMIFMVEFLLFNDLAAKIIANIIVIVFNYLASKLFVFKEIQPRS
ncbi:MAG TPA: GtrA family protein [Peptococcaceae bacterium]|nr:GtrA family protein [Peptococcaceae bacterium]